MTPEEYVTKTAQIDALIKTLHHHRKALRKQVNNALPTKRRPATTADIKVGQIVYYEHGDDGPFWQIVREVERPGDEFKAYTADDGCRYGLDDAWIRVE